MLCAWRPPGEEWNMTDRITITGIRGIGHHGVFEHERINGQEFVVDVILTVDIQRAIATDDLADTVDYGAVADAVHSLIVGEPLNLIETLADRMAQACLAFDGVRSVVVTVHKPQAPIQVPFADVTITVERGHHG
jgi:dihydroneopterin aldolase